jgi:hypothetical protein
MLRFAAILAVLYAAPASAQSITDGSDRGLPRDQIAKLIESVGGNFELGARTQIRRLHRVNMNNGVYFCGQANTGSGWRPFYYDTFNGASRAGDLAEGICGR